MNKHKHKKHAEHLHSSFTMESEPNRRNQSDHNVSSVSKPSNAEAGQSSSLERVLKSNG